jgi:hypothetical protein
MSGAPERAPRVVIPRVATLRTAAVNKGLTRCNAEIMHPARAWDRIARTTAEAVRNSDKVGWL